MSIAERFRAAREHAGLSQGGLAERCAELGHSVSRGQIAKLEVGERVNPRASDAAAIARATGVRLPWLLDGSAPMLEDDGEAQGGATKAPFEAAIDWFLTTEHYEGREESARSFLEERREIYAGAEKISSPEAWLAKLKDDFRTWRGSSKKVGSYEIAEGDDLRPQKLNVRRRQGV